MDLKAMGYLEAIVANGSFMKAAASVNLTQPALSKAISQLESECGLQLLNRGKKGLSVSPTAAGEVVLRSIRVMLEERRKLMAELESIRLKPHD